MLTNIIGNRIDSDCDRWSPAPFRPPGKLAIAAAIGSLWNFRLVKSAG